MNVSLLEIVELSNGDIILQRANGEGEPLLKITFSSESKQFLRDAKLDVAKVMIHAGVQVVGQMAGLDKAVDVDDEFDNEGESEYIEEEAMVLH